MTQMNLSLKQTHNQEQRDRRVAKGELERAEEEAGVSRRKLLHVGWINNKVQLHSTENYIQYCSIKHNGKAFFFKKRMCVYISLNHFVV